MDASTASPLSGATTLDWASMGRLLLTSLGVMGSPGPATISLVATNAGYGIRRSLGYLIGMILGTWAVLATVATGTTAALLAVPALGTLVTVASGAYILWLAYRLATAPPLGGSTAGARAPSLAAGLGLGIANPKAWVAIAATFNSARLVHAAVTDAALKGAVLCGMVVLILAGWLLAGSLFAPLQRGRDSRLVNGCLAAALVAAVAFTLIR